jgi:hypothetical protein
VGVLRPTSYLQQLNGLRQAPPEVGVLRPTSYLQQLNGLRQVPPEVGVLRPTSYLQQPKKETDTHLRGMVGGARVYCDRPQNVYAPSVMPRATYKNC